MKPSDRDPLTGERRIPTEHQEQAAFFQWCLCQTGPLADARWIFAIPNGGHRHIGAAKKLKAEGVRAGVPDLFLPVPKLDDLDNLKAGLFIEMKVQVGGKVSDTQKEWHQFLKARRYEVVVANGFDEAVKAVTEYLK